MSTNKRFRFLTTKIDNDGDLDSEQGPNSALIISFYDPEIKAADAHGRTLEDILDWGDAKLERCHNYIQMLFPLPEGSPFNWEAPVIDCAVMEAFLEREELRANLRRSFERMLNFYGFVVAGEEDEEKDGTETEDKGKGEGEGGHKGGNEGEGKGKVDESESAKEEHKESKGKEPAQESSGPTSVSESHSATQDTEPKATDEASKPSQESKEPESSSTAAAEASASTEADAKSKTEPSPKGYHIDLAPYWQQAFRNWAVRFDHNHLRITRILRCLRVLGLQEECEAFYSMLKYVFNHPSIHINERSMTYWQRAVRLPLHVAPDGERILWLKKWEMEQEEEEKKKMEGVEQN